MVGSKYMSTQDGAVTVIAIRGCREWVIQWDDTGHISVAQANATKIGCIRDGSKISVGRRDADTVRVAEAYATIQQDILKLQTIAERIKRLSRAGCG